jgi:DNA-binding CsgD family transcriptional regulator
VPLRQRQVLFQVASGISNQEIAYTLGISESSVATHLSRAEQEIAWRVVNGESHKAIARARGTSMNTVANQLASLFSKLGVNRRSELTHALRASDEG